MTSSRQAGLSQAYTLPQKIFATFPRSLKTSVRLFFLPFWVPDGLARNQAVTHTTGSHAFATLKLTIALIHQAVFKDSLNGACGLLGLC